MKKVNLSTVLVLVFMVLSLSVVAQTGTGTSQQMLTNANTQVSAASTTLKTIMTTILWLFAGGGFVYAAYTAFFDQQQMRRALIGLIVGVLFGTIAGAMQLLN
jgi:hypothetical protein